jgi:hypothetical protein
VGWLPGDQLPYADDVVNLLIAEAPDLARETEIARVLCMAQPSLPTAASTP